ncbi:MAG: lipocalin family protein [Gammaproteobacteria bacterium]|nr:lipocalin family protein [Gammaproteobacteria bacterium]
MKQYLVVAFLTLILTGCASQLPMKTVEYVDIDRFMGDWYVVANIPTFIEKQAHNAVENYRLDEDGSIATTFTFNKGGFDGKQKTYNPRGFIKDTSTNALWGMQFIWPIKADYRIVYLDENYQNTVIARAARDYVWVMSRKPDLSDEEFNRFKTFVDELGYDVAKLQKVPQQWPQTSAQ